MVFIIKKWNGVWLRRALYPNRFGNPGWALSQECCCNEGCVCDELPDTIYNHTAGCGSPSVTMTEISTTHQNARVWEGTYTYPDGTNTWRFACTVGALAIGVPGTLCHFWWCTDACNTAPGSLCNQNSIDTGGGWNYLGDYEFETPTELDIQTGPLAPPSLCYGACVDDWYQRFTTSASRPSGW